MDRDPDDTDIGAQLFDQLDRLSPPQPPRAPQEEIGSEELDRRIEETLRRVGAVTSAGETEPAGASRRRAKR